LHHRQLFHFLFYEHVEELEDLARDPKANKAGIKEAIAEINDLGI
jgi:hypothetical protein